MRHSLLFLCLSGLLPTAPPARSQSAQLRDTTLAIMPSRADSNSPVFHRDGELVMLNSTGIQMVSYGPDQFTQTVTRQVWVDRPDHQPLWIESVSQDPDGTVYGWYHHEPQGVCGPGSTMTAPVIGAVVSYDGGFSYADLGIVLSAGDPLDCGARNGFFAGGHGDFSVILDRRQDYFYFLFGNYGGPLSGQGIAMARMAFADRGQPVGALWKYFEGGWDEAGLGGRVTPVFPAAVAWQQSNTDSYWGPSVHWNTFLESYVVLMNRSCCKPLWPQDGIYVTFNPDLSDPSHWTTPVRILGKVAYDAGYYPEVIGTAPGETDSIAGELARFYVHGRSYWNIEFSREPFRPTPTPEPPDSGGGALEQNLARLRR
jgi:hypothetical protein